MSINSASSNPKKIEAFLRFLSNHKTDLIDNLSEEFYENYGPLDASIRVPTFEWSSKEIAEIKSRLLKSGWSVKQESPSNIQLQKQQQIITLRTIQENDESTNPRMERKFISDDHKTRELELRAFVSDLWLEENEVVTRFFNIDYLDNVRSTWIDRSFQSKSISGRYDVEGLDKYLTEHIDLQTWQAYRIEDGFYGYNWVHYPIYGLSNLEKRKMWVLVFRKSQLKHIGGATRIFSNTKQKKQALLWVLYKWYPLSDIEKWYILCSSDNSKEQYIKKVIESLDYLPNQVHVLSWQVKNIIHDAIKRNGNKAEQLRFYEICNTIAENIGCIFEDINENTGDIWNQRTKLSYQQKHNSKYLEYMPKLSKTIEQFLASSQKKS